MFNSARTLGLLAGLSLMLGTGARAQRALAATSPFLPADGTTTTTTEVTPLELRGIMSDSSGFRFSIYDPARHLNQWVKLNEAGHEFTVKTHDQARDVITLDYRGQMLTLPLRTSRVVGLAVVAEPSGPGAGPGAGPGPRPNMGGPGAVVMGGSSMSGPKLSTPEEAARFNRAVEEINRRRAIRDRGSPPTPK